MHRGLDPGRLSGGVLTCMCGLVSGSPMEKGSRLFLRPFSSRCSRCIVVLFLGMLPFARTAGHGAESIVLRCVALLGLAARSLQQQPILFSSRVYICRVLILSQFPFFIDRWSCPMLLLFFLFYRRSTSIKLLLGSSKM